MDNNQQTPIPSSSIAAAPAPVTPVAPTPTIPPATPSPVQAPVNQTPPPQPKTTDKKKMLLWILGYLALGAIVFAGVYFFRTWQQSQELSSVTPASPSPAISRVPTQPEPTSPPLTTNTQTYTSKSCSITLDYPNTWKAQPVQPSSNSIASGEYNSPCAYFTSSDFKVEIHRTGMFIQISRTAKGSMFKNVTINSSETYITSVENITDPPMALVRKNATYGSYSGLLYETQLAEDLNNFVFEKGNYIFNVSWPIKEESKNSQDIQTIISSIK